MRPDDVTASKCPAADRDDALALDRAAERAGKLLLPVAVDAGDAADLAGVDGEGDVAQRHARVARRRREAFDAQRDPRLRRASTVRRVVV